MAFRTKTYEAYGNIRVKPNQPCNYLNRGHKSKVNIFGQYIIHKRCVAERNRALAIGCSAEGRSLNPTVAKTDKPLFTQQ